MTDFKGIRGWKVQTLSTDPVASQAEGGTWSSGGSMNTARASSIGTATGSSNAFVAGGYTGPPGRITNTESYNGTSWTEVADIPTAYNYGNGFGTNTASVHAGSDPVAVTTYVWDGTSWSTPGNNLGTNRFLAGTSGTSTAGSIFGGGQPGGGSPASTLHEQWDGTSWTETTDMSTARKHVTSGLGIQTAALAVNGISVPQVEEWNGSSWTEIAETNTQRYFSSGSGIVTTALVIGGYDQPGATYTAKTEFWNGSSWTELSDMATARGVLGNGGSGYSSGSSDAICYGGLTSGGFSVTEEWSAPSTFSKINVGQVYFNSTANAFKVTEQPVPGGSWSSGGNLNTARSLPARGAIGTQTAGILIGGETPTVTGATEIYDGSSWTEVNDLNTGRAASGGAGTSTSAVIAVGYTTANVTNAETWNGSSWTEVSEANTARYGASGLGSSSTDGLIAGGNAGPVYYDSTEVWNGSSWTEVNNLNTGRYGMASGGTTTDGMVFGGADPLTAKTEVWDGTNWTEVNDLNSAGHRLGGAGTSSLAALAFGGQPNPTNGARTETWDGSSWTERSELASPRARMGSSGSAAEALASGGTSPAPAQVATTEEWTAPITNKTITVS